MSLFNLHFNCFYLYISNSFYFSRFFGTRKLQLNFHLILRTLLHGAHFHFALNYFTLHLALCPAESPQIRTRTRIRIFRLELYWARARALLLYVMVGGFSLGAEPTTTTKTDFPRWAFAFISFFSVLGLSIFRNEFSLMRAPWRFSTNCQLDKQNNAQCLKVSCRYILTVSHTVMLAS